MQFCIRRGCLSSEGLSSLRGRKASVSVQAFVGKRVSSIEVYGDDLGMGPRPSKDMTVSRLRARKIHWQSKLLFQIVG